MEDLWKEAEGINSTNGENPSEYLQELINENEVGNKTTEEIIEDLKEYYNE